jgi:hypothetical protein
MTSSSGHPNICVDATSIEPASIVIIIEPEASTVQRKLLQDQLGYYLREGGKTCPPHSSPLSIDDDRPSGLALFGCQEARSCSNAADEAQGVVPSLSAQVHPPPPGRGVGGGELDQLQRRHPLPKKRFSCVRAAPATKKEGMCLSSKGNIATRKPLSSRESWQVVKSKCSKSYASPSTSETCRQQQ